MPTTEINLRFMEIHADLNDAWSAYTPWRWRFNRKVSGVLLLTRRAGADIATNMAQSFLVLDFGTDEETAQQARHRLDRWKQTFRLDKKLLLKFDREEKAADGAEGQRIVVIIRLDFSDHERLSEQRWLDRIPSEAPFKEAHPKLIRQGDADFASTTKRFDDLD